MMSLTEHLVELPLRSAERLERLPEVQVHEVLEQPIVDANCSSEQFIREHVQINRFIFEENLREHSRGDVLVRLCVQHANIVALDDQLVHLLQGQMPAMRAVIVAPVLVFSYFQGPRFVAIILRHGCMTLPRTTCFKLVNSDNVNPDTW